MTHLLSRSISCWRVTLPLSKHACLSRSLKQLKSWQDCIEILLLCASCHIVSTAAQAHFLNSLSPKKSSRRESPPVTYKFCFSCFSSSSLYRTSRRGSTIEREHSVRKLSRSWRSTEKMLEWFGIIDREGCLCVEKQASSVGEARLGNEQIPARPYPW
jgi:hypothetical protein